MPDNYSASTDDRLQNSIHGTPKINPDEQRKYLGTFRERVGFTISVQELISRDWTIEFAKELTQNYVQIIFINGNLEQEKIKPFILIATKAGINFTLKTSPEFHTNPDNLAIVVANKQAINLSTITASEKYPIDDEPSNQKVKQSFWQKLFQ